MIFEIKETRLMRTQCATEFESRFIDIYCYSNKLKKFLKGKIDYFGCKFKLLHFQDCSAINVVFAFLFLVTQRTHR